MTTIAGPAGNDDPVEPLAVCSALYVGTVMHQRLRPARHRLRYRMFSLLLDLDELSALARRLRWFSLNRFNVFSLHERDYGDVRSAADGAGLRACVERQLRAAGLPAGGAIRLLTMPRILGYAFNPLSVYFCDDADGALQALIYEVNNTFGERHSYLIEVDAGERDGGAIVQRCAKRVPRLAVPRPRPPLRLSRRAAPARARRAEHRRRRQRRVRARSSTRASTRERRRLDDAALAARLLQPSAADAEGHRRDPLGSAAPDAQGHSPAGQARRRRATPVTIVKPADA